MTDTTTDSGQVTSVSKILAALTELGEATAAALAQHAGIGYSTTTPKLRALEADGHAERFRTTEGHTLWRLTSTARAGTAADATGTPSNDGGEQPPSGNTAVAAASDSADPDPLEGEGPSERDLHDVPAAGHDMTHSQPGMDNTEPALPEPGTVADPAVDTAQQSVPRMDTTTADPARATLPDADDTDPTSANDDKQPQPQMSVNEPAATHSGAERDGGAPRRSPGSMRAAILDVCEAHPDRQYKVGELCKLIDQANEGTGAAKASQGAVYNAAVKLAGTGTLVQTVETPATFQLAARTD
ncbi:MAG TPA: MarR family transcriptional regulator [Actinoplanes sp.]